MDDSMARQYGSAIMAGRIRPGASPMTGDAIGMSASDASLVVRTLGAIRSNNDRLAGLGVALMDIADTLFGSDGAKGGEGMGGQAGCRGLASEIADEVNRTALLLSNLEREVERLRMVA